MPYIEKDQRKALDKLVLLASKGEVNLKERVPGDLNYLVTNLLLAACEDKHSYTTYNELIGVLECVKLEFYRRQVSIYEDEKRLINGDVFR